MEARRSRTTAIAPTSADPTTASTFAPPLTLSTWSGAYAQLVWRPTAAVDRDAGAARRRLPPGARQDFPALEPRLTARYALTPEWTLKGGAALLHQPPTVLLNLPVFDAASLKYGLQSGAQFDVGAEWRPFGALEVVADAYYAPIFRAVELALTDVIANRERLSLPGFDPGVPGRGYGFELMVRHPIGQRWFGWLSYSLERSERSQTYAVFDGANDVVSTQRGWVPFAFQQVHSANAAASYQFPSDVTVGVVVHFNTGRPETGDIASRGEVAGTDPNTGAATWVFAPRNQVANLPPFFRVDLRVSKTWTFRDFLLEGSLDVFNATLNQEVLAYSYSVDGTGALTKLPTQVPFFVPMLGLKATY